MVLAALLGGGQVLVALLAVGVAGHLLSQILGQLLRTRLMVCLYIDQVDRLAAALPPTSQLEELKGES